MRRVPFGRALEQMGGADRSVVGVGYLLLWVVWQPEPNRFSRAGIKHFWRSRPGTLDVRYVMHPKGRALVKRTCVGECMLATRPIDVKANPLMADWA